MKKICTLLISFTILLSVVVSPASAQQNNNNMGNNYRTNAATNDNDTDWSWIGLLGLAGLFGLRGRNRERT
jgi:MYXO-CTERM domain-containing protein